MLSCCFLRVENALWREPAEEVLPVRGLEDRQDLDGGGEDGGGVVGGGGSPSSSLKSSCAKEAQVKTSIPHLSPSVAL